MKRTTLAASSDGASPTPVSHSCSSLAGVQQLMAQAIMRPLSADESMQETWADGSPASQIAARIIKPNDRLSSFERLQIYNQQYWWRLLGSFGEDFRGLRAVLGERRFDRLAVAYLEHFGSNSWNLRNLGSKLEGFLREHPEWTAPDEPLALDMARVEWARVEAFDGPELPPIDPQRIAAVPPDRLRFRLQPYLTLLELAYPVDDLLRKLKSSDADVGATSNAVSMGRPRRRRRLTARPSRQPVHLAVHRVDYSVYYKRLDPAAYRLLRGLREGETLEAACDAAFRDNKDLPETCAANVQTWFATWTRFGWLCAPPLQGRERSPSVP